MHSFAPLLRSIHPPNIHVVADRIDLPRVLKRCNLLLDVDSRSAVESNDSSHFGWVTKGCFRVFKEGEYYGFLAFTPWLPAVRNRHRPPTLERLAQ